MGIFSKPEIEKTARQTRKLLEKYNFEIVDTLDDSGYRLRRLDMGFHIQKFVGKESRDPAGDENAGMQMATMQIADTLISMEESDTLVIADQGSAIPAARVRYIAKKLGMKNNLAGLFYAEPLDLAGKGLMYHADEKYKLHLNEDGEKKIKDAVTTGGPSLEYFRKYGGRYYECPVGELESLIAKDDQTVQENCRRCMEGDFLGGCKEHKDIVQIECRNFEEAFR